MSNKIIQFKEELSLVLCGQAGQGLKTIEDILSNILKKSGYNVFTTTEYMSRIRGGFNSTEIRVSSKPVSAFTDKIDILISIGHEDFDHLENKVDQDTIIAGELVKTGVKNEFMEVPFEKIASESGNKLYASAVAAGFISGLLNVDINLLSEYLRKYFFRFPEKVIEGNIDAAKKGYDRGTELFRGKIEISISRDTALDGHIILDGSDAVSFGAIAGGCNFVSAYPMAPATGVLTFLSRVSKKFGIVAEQAEDEIGAINMCIGAWSAGARAIATTSGGGFALMCEGLSLAGIMEVPLVIHLAQRPGPATGLPTRTVQGDLELSLYAGHGDFPRVLFSPRNMEECFSITREAFNLADKYQIPVFILTDNFIINSSSNIPLENLKLSEFKIDHCFTKTDKNYKRYKFTKDGISPRGIPGYGEGLVSYDSHEHTEDGHVNENFEITVRMQDDRMKKLEGVKKEVFEPELLGKEDYNTLVIAWGSTYGAVKEALFRIKRDDISFLSFNQVYPLHHKTEDYLRKAKNIIIVENNLTAQFAKLIRMYTGIEITKKVLKYDGLPFSVEEVTEKIIKLLY